MDTRQQVKLKLPAPEQSRPERGSMLSGGRRFERWLESLPLGNMTAAGNQLLGALKDMNRSRLGARQRLEMLDRAVEPVLTVVEVLDKHYRDTTFPLDEKKDRVGRVAMQFFRELALGYRLVGEGLVDGRGGVGMLHRRTVVRSLHCALAASEQQLFRLGLLYQQTPANIWREINVIYAFLRQNALHNKVLETPLTLASGPASADALYKRMGLFAISDPSRLGQPAIRALAPAVAAWADRTDLNDELSLQGDESGLFEVSVTGDEPPVLISEDRGAGRFDLVFDVRELRAWLEGLQHAAADELQELQFSDKEGNPLIISRGLIAQLLSTWGMRLTRSHQRLAAQHQVRLLIGLRAIHFVVAGDSPFSRFLREYGDPRFAESAARDRVRFAATEGQDSRPPMYSADVLNQSLGGYRLRLSEGERLQLRVGEVVALCPDVLAEHEPLWMLGLVRWLNAIDIREIEIGVSVIGQNVRPAAVLAGKETAKSPPHRALACRPFGGQEGHLVVVPGNWSAVEETAICLDENHRTYCGPVALPERLERSSETAVFRLELLSPEYRSADSR